MDSRYTTLLLLFGVFAIAGCGSKQIDTSTEGKMKASIEAIRTSITEKERQRFDEALAAIATSKIDFSEIFSGSTASVEAKVKESLNGKTAAKVIAAGDAILQERRAKEQQQALDEIEELRKKKEAVSAARTQLAKFEVTRSRFSKRKSGFGLEEPMIELSLMNGTSLSVSRAPHFIGILASPGRPVPWIKDDFNYKIPGGMEPGETKELRLAPNMFGDWGQVEAPADAVLTVEVVRLDGPDDKPVFDAKAFDDEDAKRLQALEEKFGK